MAAKAQQLLLFAQIEQVFEGKSITIDWFTGLSQSVAVRYSTPDGTPLIHVPEVAIVSAPCPLGWVFNSYVPFRLAINKQIRRYYSLPSSEVPLSVFAITERFI